MKKLSRNEMKNVIGGMNAPADGLSSCKCLSGDPDGSCSTTLAGSCLCTSTGSPSSYSLNDSTCKIAS